MMDFVAACVVTYRRPVELTRLLDGLATSGPALGAVVVVDHAADPETEKLIEAKRRSARSETEGPRWVYVGAENLGPGAGWKRGMKEALQRFGERLTHFWAFDDDVMLGPRVLEHLLDGMRKAGADAVAPLLADSDGRIWAFPEPVSPPLRKVIREVTKPEEAAARLGGEPIEFCWCTGACVLVSRRAVESAGFHRTDFWMLGEDLEYSMRLSARFRCVFIPDVIVPHLPPPIVDREAARKGNRAKFYSLLQNLSYLALHSPDSRHMWRYLPGNFLRFFLTEGISVERVREAAGCFWRGGILGRPAGFDR